MYDSSHLLVVNRRDKVLATAYHAHYLPSKQTILGHTSEEWTEVVEGGFISLRLVYEFVLCQIGEF